MEADNKVNVVVLVEKEGPDAIIVANLGMSRT